MNINFSERELEDAVDQHSDEAEAILNDLDKTEDFLTRLSQKLKKVPVVGKKLSYIPTLAALIRAYVRKEYRYIPLGSMIAIVGAMIYFVSPMDLFPDGLLFFGYIDDIAVISFVWDMIEDDVKEYQEWKSNLAQ